MRAPPGKGANTVPTGLLRMRRSVRRRTWRLRGHRLRRRGLDLRLGLESLFLLGGEAGDRLIGAVAQRVGDALDVLDQAPALGPQRLRVGVELLDPRMRVLDDARRLALGLLDPLSRLRARLGGQLVGRL